MRWLALLMACGAIHVGAEMTLTSRGVSGVVLDESSGKPVADAVVVAVWSGGYSTFAHGGTRCARGDAVRADAFGRFQMPAWTMRHPDLQNLGVEVTAYAPGWSRAKSALAGAAPRTWLGVIPRGMIEVPAQELKVSLRRFSGTALERGDDLLALLSGTSCDGGADGGMEPLYRAIRAELIAGPAQLRHYRRDGGYRNHTSALLKIVDQSYLSRMPGGAPPDLEDVLRKAIEAQDIETIERVASAGFDLNGPMTYLHAPPLVLATLHGSPKSVRALAKAGANVDAQDMYVHTALEVALIRDATNPPTEARRTIVQALLEAGADPNRWNHGWCVTPLMNAVKLRDPQILAMLAAKGARLRDRCECREPGICDGVDGRGPLHYVQDPASARWLIEAGADVNVRDARGRTPLMLLVEHVRRGGGFAAPGLQIARMLVAAGARLDDGDLEGVSAAMRAGPEMTELLRKEGQAPPR